MSGLASAALPKQTSHCERGGSSPMEASSSETPSKQLCKAALSPALCLQALRHPLKISPLVYSCCGQTGEDVGGKSLEIREGDYRGGCFCCPNTRCHRDSVQDSEEGLEEGKETETSGRLYQYHRKLNLWKCSFVLQECLFCP